MSSTATITPDIMPTQSVARSRKKKATQTPVLVLPSSVSQGRSAQRQRECLSDWDHAS